MKDFGKLKNRVQQFGGLKLIREYSRLGLFWPLAKQFFSCLCHKRSFKSLYPIISQRVNKLLLEKYAVLDGSQIDRDLVPIQFDKQHPRIWWCWMQGEEKAPALAKACLKSLRSVFSDCQVVVITEENMHEWVQFPEYIIEKYHKGIIPPVLMSDLLRLELLIRYGGIWVDSTVLCTLPNYDDSRYVKGLHAPSLKEMLDADLFLFQYAQPDTHWNGSVSNWFIAAHHHNRLLCDVLAKLYAYWRDYDCVLQYYMMHMFIADVSKHYPEMIQNIPYGWSVPCLELGKHLGERFDAAHWQKFSNKVYCHKLSYRGVERYGVGSYYARIIDSTEFI